MVFFRLSGLNVPTEAAAVDEDEDIEPRDVRARGRPGDDPARRDRRHEDGRGALTDLRHYPLSALR